ncbi:hypothetical protein CHH75_17110 [Paenibacillus sp. 7541]|nr:hypothetical protein CHH75_17110 [Paenibacillus sp. 7541]
MLAWEDALEYYDSMYKENVEKLSSHPESLLTVSYQLGLSHLYDYWIQNFHLSGDQFTRALNSSIIRIENL